MKKEICIEIDSDLLDDIQDWGNPYEDLSQFVEKALLHVFECEKGWEIPNLWEKMA